LLNFRHSVHQTLTLRGNRTKSPFTCSISAHGAVKVKVKKSSYRPGVDQGFHEVKVPRFQDNGTGWSGPEGSRKLRFPDFKTTAQDGVAQRVPGS